MSPTANPVGADKEVLASMYVPATHAQTPLAAPPVALVEMAGGTPFAETARRPGAGTGPGLGAGTGPGAGVGVGAGEADASGRASLKLGRAQLNVLAGRQGSVTGALEPSLAGQVVVLQTLTGHGWQPIARARTGAGGRFRVRFRRSLPGSHVVRLRFAG
ncbi:MAG TPA: hypothetical protein VL972_03295, partial [Solirubrobacteraceae bacterium]|nr:hypothetical protein [Solirubrobacteraceae bacterium]